MMVPPQNEESVSVLEFRPLAEAAQVPSHSTQGRQVESVMDPLYVLDYLTALLLFIFTLPILVLSLLWVAAVDGGNPFFTQIRVGLHGRPYRIFKIRSMRHDQHRPTRFCAHGDERILPGGNLLRKTRIDELPQLFNVLKGDMALVGPRPEQPEFVAEFVKEIPRYNERLKVKPGITGLAQVTQGYVDSLDGTRIKVEFDLMFIRERSLALWFRIVISTIRVIVFRHGAR